MTTNKLQLNENKTEVLLIRSRFDVSVCPIEHINVGSAVIQPIDSARNIGVIFDNTLQFNKHVIVTCRGTYLQINRIGRIRKYLSFKICLTLVLFTIITKLDYCNSLLYGLPKTQISLLQRAQNSAARLVAPSSHFTARLRITYPN